MIHKELWYIVSFASPIVLLMGIIVGLLNFIRLGAIYRIVVVYLAICFVTDLLTRYLGAYSHMKYNLFMIPIFGFLELVVFSILYYKHILRIKSNYLLLFIVAMLLLILSEIAFAPRLFHRETFHSYGKVIADVSVLFFCLLYYVQVFKGHIPVNSGCSVLNSVVFVYYSVNLLIFLAVNFLVNAKLTYVVFFWVVNLISMVLFYLILIYLIWRNGKTRKIMQ